MQHICNTHANHMQTTCNTHATHMQHTCNTHANIHVSESVTVCACVHMVICICVFACVDVCVCVRGICYCVRRCFSTNDLICQMWLLADFAGNMSVCLTFVKCNYVTTNVITGWFRRQCPVRYAMLCSWDTLLHSEQMTRTHTHTHTHTHTRKHSHSRTYRHLHRDREGCRHTDTQMHRHIHTDT